MPDISNIISVTPIIKYPKTGVVGKTYCMSIDLEQSEGISWEVEEDYPVYCNVSSDLFENIFFYKNPVILLHRHGTRGSVAVFLRSINREPREGYIDVSLSNKFGLPIYYKRLDNIQIKSLSSDFCEKYCI